MKSKGSVPNWTPTGVLQLKGVNVKERKWSGPARQKVQVAAGAIRASRKLGGRWSPIVESTSFARQRIDAKYLAQEAGLAESKWIAYRYMTAYQCTELFAKEYEDAFKHAYARHKDFGKATSRVPVSAELALNSPAEIVSLWKSRQMADKMGVPYSLFLRIAIEAALEARKYKNVPRPNQLCGEWQLAAIKRAWDEEVKVANIFADDWDPRFFADQFMEEPPQLAAYEALYDRIMERPEDRRALALSNYLGKAISVAGAQHLFTPALVAEAQANRPAVVGIAGPRLDFYVPACMGLRSQTDEAICSGCKSAPLCDRVTKLADQSLLKATGTVTPREDAVRQGNRERKEKQRASERASDLA